MSTFAKGKSNGVKITLVGCISEPLYITYYSQCTSTRTVPVLGKCNDSIEYLKEYVTNISFVNTNIFLYCFSHHDHEMKNL